MELFGAVSLLATGAISEGAGNTHTLTTTKSFLGANDALSHDMTDTAWNAGGTTYALDIRPCTLNLGTSEP